VLKGKAYFESPSKQSRVKAKYIGECGIEIRLQKSKFKLNVKSMLKINRKIDEECYTLNVVLLDVYGGTLWWLQVLHSL
jgi:hypothetical protein